MPQASAALRALMGRYFNDEVSDAGPLALLLSRGYTEKGGLLSPPVPSHNPTAEEFAVLRYLCEEWDYGFKACPYWPEISPE